VYLVIYIVGSILAGLVIGGIAGRFAIPVGMLVLLIGAGPMIALYLYSRFIGFDGDSSAQGMLSTIIFIMVVPAGLTTIATGFFRGGR
jgi:hypothetical protein